MDILCDYNADGEMMFETAMEQQEDIFVSTLEEFQRLVKAMNDAAKGEASYLFQKMKGNHWILEEDVHDEDETGCGIFKVAKGEVYAISHDVMKFFKEICRKFDF
ncbi:MAG: hypothetical protein ABII07_03875 [Patescibacteria group bacterium]|nr:hypothetical protein [Patescibacteria group bacterium]